jgi:hypothetical protein
VTVHRPSPPNTFDWTDIPGPETTETEDLREVHQGVRRRPSWSTPAGCRHQRYQEVVSLFSSFCPPLGTLTGHLAPINPNTADTI